MKLIFILISNYIDESGSFVRYMNDEDYFERSNDDASASSMEFSNNYVIKMNNELRGNVARISLKNNLTHTATNDILRLLLLCLFSLQPKCALPNQI